MLMIFEPTHAANITDQQRISRMNEYANLKNNRARVPKLVLSSAALLGEDGYFSFAVTFNNLLTWVRFVLH